MVYALRLLYMGKNKVGVAREHSSVSTGKYRLYAPLFLLRHLPNNGERRQRKRLHERVKIVIKENNAACSA